MYDYNDWVLLDWTAYDCREHLSSADLHHASVPVHFHAVYGQKILYQDLHKNGVQ